MAAALDHPERRQEDAAPGRGHVVRGERLGQGEHAVRVPAVGRHTLHALPGHLDPGGADPGAAHDGALRDGEAHHGRGRKQARHLFAEARSLAMMAYSGCTPMYPAARAHQARQGRKSS